MSGITFNIGELEDLKMQVGQWAARNFAHTLPTKNTTIYGLMRCTTGMVEELGELLEQTDDTTIRPEMDMSEVSDAIADILIYSLDFMFTANFMVASTLAADVSPSRWEVAFDHSQMMPNERDLTIITNGLAYTLGRLSHHVLKQCQGIRKKEDHWHQMQVMTCRIWRLCFVLCSSLGIDFHDLVRNTVDRVTKRDWVQNPDEAHLAE